MKYFYTDSLAAAWMAKHFGMMFNEDGIIWNAPDDRGAKIGFCNKQYIHPDSLHLLEPKIDDIIMATVDNILRPIVLNPFTKHEIRDAAIGSIPIISRNGIPFMWPEIEA